MPTMQEQMPASTDAPPFGALLREVRSARHLSQLDLSLQAEVSQRHLSFLESGRAQPSREMILQLAQALDLPLREQNRLLISAGYAGVYPQRPLAATDMQPVRQALELMLKHHEPYPAMVVDRAWYLFSANAALARVFSMIGDLGKIWSVVCPDGKPNILKLTFHPQGLRPFIRNFEEVAAPLLARTAREALEHPQVNQVLEEILRYPDIPPRWRNISLNSMPLPVIPAHFHVNGVDLKLFTMLCTFGTPQDITTDELRVELSFPADAASEALLRALSPASPVP